MHVVVVLVSRRLLFKLLSIGAGLVQVYEQCCSGETSCPTLQAAAQFKFSRMCELVPTQCNDNGRLVHLSLISEGLQCAFPRSLNRLTALTRLDLTFNKLTGR